ncbi:hypothetical protein EYF80_065270 [Liparis tanakae]|uniref:Uncharacterized protein n=1 Tax=Liparis tanakae TaxID=230148 RepID=A0A4Z2E7S8_9TELE|nr:hypothetical protein EYF80_065270 [Liparis tanakae]
MNTSASEGMPRSFLGEELPGGGASWRRSFLEEELPGGGASWGRSFLEEERRRTRAPGPQSE